MTELLATAKKRIEEGTIRPEHVSYDERNVRLGSDNHFNFSAHSFYAGGRPRYWFAKVLELFKVYDCWLHPNDDTRIFSNTIGWGQNNNSYPSQLLFICGKNCVIGGPGFGYEFEEDGTPFRIPHLGNVVIGENVELGSNVCIDRAVVGSTVICDNVKIDNLVHIAHNAKIGRNTLIVAGAVIGGSVEIGENCFIGMNASIKQKVKIGNRVTIGAGAVVLKDVPDGETWVGNPAKKLEK